MVYIIVGFTSNIDLKNRTAEIRFLQEDNTWGSEISAVKKFYSRASADAEIMKNSLIAVSYGIKETERNGND